jgi:hypothetical protein
VEVDEVRRQEAENPAGVPGQCARILANRVRVVAQVAHVTVAPVVALLTPLLHEDLAGAGRVEEMGHRGVGLHTGRSFLGLATGSVSEPACSIVRGRIRPLA